MDYQWRNRRGEGDRVPPETSEREILLTYRGKRQGKKGKGVKIEKEREG